MDKYDLLLAQQLQQDFDKEYDSSVVSNSKRLTAKGLEQPFSIVDESWELIDPNPDVRALFMEFNDKFFWGRLDGIEVRWSPRMTLCAGLCCYEGKGGLCSVRLSVPLLKLRPRKDLVETLLHEMIHAFLFVAENNREHAEHGPNFQKHMHRINKATGANITIYHNFHDEVNSYQQHWWLCNGPCKNRPPYYGYVKRAMNRAPSANDFWWADHLQTCGGTYTKVKEPEGYGVRKKGNREDKKSKESLKPGKNGDIRSFLGAGHHLVEEAVVTEEKQAAVGAGRHKDTVVGKNKHIINGKTHAINIGNHQGRATSTSNGYSVNFSNDTGTDKHGKEMKSEKDVSDNAGLNWSGGIWSDNHVQKGDVRNPTPYPNTKNQGPTELDSVYLIDSNDDSWDFPPVKSFIERVSSSDKENNANDKSPLMCHDQISAVKRGAGHVLGGGGQIGLSLLATLRKQWASEDTSGKDSPCSNSSFHVSSCEEDNWTSPEHSHEEKISKSHKMTKKRALEFSSSQDEDRCSLSLGSKRLKLLPTKDNVELESSSKLSDKNYQIFQRIKEKCDSKLPRKSEKNPGGSKDPTKSTVDPNSNRVRLDRNENKSSSKETGIASRAPGHVAADGNNSSLITTSGSSSTFQTESGSLQGIIALPCPVCQKSVLASNINSHLDECLNAEIYNSLDHC